MLDGGIHRFHEAAHRVRFAPRGPDAADPRMPRRRPKPSIRPAHQRFSRLAALLVLLWLQAPLPAQPAPAPPTPYDQLVEAGASPESRLAAATQILQNPQDTATLARTLDLLASDPTAGEASRTILIAASRLPQAPSGCLAPFLAIARDAASPFRIDAIRALASCRSREAAAALIELTPDSQPPGVRDAALQSLAQLSGRDDLGANPASWREWLARSLTLSERQWEQELLLAQSRRVQRLETSLSDAERRLIDAWRQIHLLTPVESRSGVLVRLLTDEVPPLRNLGFELVNRELSENRVLQPAVAEAAIGLLQNPDPLVRAQAALVLNRLAPPDAGAPILAALDKEADPRAADALLQAASRWPSPLAVRPALRWLEAAPALRLRAAGLAWALLRAGYLQSDEEREAILKGLRPLDTASLTGAACRLLTTLGDERDLARVQELLRSPDPPARATAADALGLRADQMDVILAAATDDPAIFEAAGRAARAHLQDARGYSALARLPAPSPQVRARVLAEYAAVLPTDELVRLAKLTSEPTDALPLLNPLIAPERLASPGQASHLAEGLLLLARTNVALGNPSDALNALSLIPETEFPATPAELVDLRAVLLLWLNRIDQAEQLDASPDAWLEALERAVMEPHAILIAERLEERFGEALTPEHRERLARLLQKVAEVDGGSFGEGG